MSKENYDGEEGLEAVISSGNNNNNNNNNRSINGSGIGFQNLHQYSSPPPLHHQQETAVSLSGGSSSSSSLLSKPLLKLTRTPSFDEAFLAMATSQEHQQIPDQKIKASNFPIICIQIGPWKMSSKHEGDLLAKVYYAKQKLVWEILEGPTKKKIEIQWSDISGINAIMNDTQPGTWMIELDKAPSFFTEINPQPRKHTVWQSTNDFTQGYAATNWRIHCVSCPSGVLNKHYDKLLHSNQKLFELSRKPFPTTPSRFFDFSPSTLLPRFHPNEFQNPAMIDNHHQHRDNNYYQYEGTMRVRNDEEVMMVNKMTAMMLSMMRATNNEVLMTTTTTVNNNWDHHHHHHVSMEPNQTAPPPPPLLAEEEHYYEHQHQITPPLLEHHHGSQPNETTPLLDEEHHQLLSSLLNVDDNNSSADHTTNPLLSLDNNNNNNNNPVMNNNDNQDNLFHGNLNPYIGL